MTNTAIEAAFCDFYKKKNELDNNMKEFIRVILKETPGNSIDISEDPAYCTDSNGIDYYEEKVYGIRLNNNNLEITLLSNSSGEADWSDRDYIRSEHSHYCTINWLELLNTIRFCF